MPADTTGPRRYLIATAIAHYPNAPQLDRPGLVEARNQIITLFTDDLGYEHVHTLGLDPTREQLPRLLRTFCRDKAARHPDDIVAVYITGHGEVLDDTHEHVLLTADADPDDVKDALRTAHLAQKMLHGTWVRRVLLMLDTCYSGHGGNELTATAITTMTHSWGDEPGSGLAIITSAQPAQQAETGAFPRLLRGAIQALPTAGSNPAALPLDALVAAMNANATRPGYQTIGYGVTGLTGEVPPFLPNPRHDPQMTEVDLAIQQAGEFEAQADRRDTELRTRLLVRAMGGSSNGTGGWWFAGWHAALLEATAWLQHPDPARPMRVVTGNPGSGKTAVLGLIATQSWSMTATRSRRSEGSPPSTNARSEFDDMALAGSHVRGQDGARHGDVRGRSRWSRALRQVSGAIFGGIARLRGEDSRGTSSLSERVIDLLADRDAGERVHRLVRLLVVGAVLIVAMVAGVLIVHPEVLGALDSAP